MRDLFKKDAFKILLYLTAVLALGAVLAPALYNLGKAVVGFRVVQPDSGGIGAYLHRVLSGSDFKRYFNRAMMLAALICLYPLLKSLQVKRSDLGLEKNPRWLAQFGVGFVVAAAFLLIMGGVYLWMNIFKTHVPLTAGHFASSPWSISLVVYHQ